MNFNCWSQSFEKGLYYGEQKNRLYRPYLVFININDSAKVEFFQILKEPFLILTDTLFSKVDTFGNIQYIGKKIFLYCIDVNKEMLKCLKEFLVEHKIRNFKTIKSFDRKLPLKDNFLDCIFTFNAVHHFKILQFLKESSRILKNGGYLFIYTRLRSQNRRNIWGKYFPLFNEKETRLYGLNELRSLIRKTPKLKIETIEYFKCARLSSLDWLLEQAQSHHYSTFYLYTKKELEVSLEKFKKNIQRNFKDLNKINWFDENILLVVRKQIN